MHVIKELAEGRAIATPAGEVRIPWVRDGKLDVWMAGYGPKALALVGRRADGFILQLADPVILRWTLESPRPPTSATTSPTRATSAAGSEGWSATTWPTWCGATARAASEAVTGSRRR